MAEQVNLALARALTLISTGPCSIRAAAERVKILNDAVCIDSFVPGHSTPACWLLVH